MHRILVVGVGNTIMADDGLGVRALESLTSRPLPDHVDTLEAGTALLDALPDLSEYDKVVLIDAVASDGQTVTVLRNVAASGLPRPGLSLHEMGIAEALRLRLLADGKLPEIVVMGLKPRQIGMSTELSDEVEAEIPELVSAVLDEIQ
jgi:hydrogenase maturation protease